VPPRPRGLLNYKCLNQAPRTTAPLAFAQAHPTTQTFHRSLFLQQSCPHSNQAETQFLAMMQLQQRRQQWKKSLHHKPRAQKPPPPMSLYFSTSSAQPNEDTSRAMHITSSRTSVGDSSTGMCNTARKCSSVVGSANVAAVQTSPLLNVSTKTP
jgi:hypothetical protein